MPRLAASSGDAEVDYQACRGCLSSTQQCRHYLHTSLTTTMAPSLEEPVQVDFEAPLKAAPQLVAPEPGRFAPPPQATQKSTRLTHGSQNIVLDQNLPQLVKRTRAQDAPIKQYAPRRPKALTRTFPSSQHDLALSNTRSWYSLAKAE